LTVNRTFTLFFTVGRVFSNPDMSLKDPVS
jgi:hypothetical protein